MNVLSCVNWFLDDDMRCGWNNIVLLLELNLCRGHDIHIHMSFLVNFLQEFKVLECLAMVIEL